MTTVRVRVSRSADLAGGSSVRVGVRLVDQYLEFLSGRCRPNTVVAAAYDLKGAVALLQTEPVSCGLAGQFAAIRGIGQGRRTRRGLDHGSAGQR
jgi:integrase/recombinase XerD